MTQENKKLLLKDLCDRLPYGVLLNVTSRYANKQQNAYTMVGIVESDVLVEIEYDPSMGMMDARPLHVPIKDVKSYLRSMSSMTEEELNECVCQSGIKDIECPNWQDIPKEKQFEARLNHAIAVFLTDSNNVDWLNAHHFDYRGLIPMGLALEAPEGMYCN